MINSQTNINFFKDLVPLIGEDNSNLIEFLIKIGLLKSSISCLYCSDLMTFRNNSTSDSYRWRCKTKECLKYKTYRRVRCSSAFEGSKAELKKLVYLIYSTQKKKWDKQKIKIKKKVKNLR